MLITIYKSLHFHQKKCLNIINIFYFILRNSVINFKTLSFEEQHFKIITF